jgi:hypothetical protein
MCARPARWSKTDQHWMLYCRGTSCHNRERICQAAGCGRTFIMNVDGAGTKYCSTECKKVGYTAGYGAPTRFRCCAWCGEESRTTAPRRSDAVWPYVCSTCTGPIAHLVSRLKRHRVPHDMARRLLDNPGCEACGRDIVTKVRDTTTGKARAMLVVDHDHQCCPGGNSCGLCVRGLVCESCNLAAGMIQDDPGRARSLAAYLDRFA